MRCLLKDLVNSQRRTHLLTDWLCYHCLSCGFWLFRIITCHPRFSCRILALELEPAFAIRTKNMIIFRYFILYFLRKRSNFIIFSLPNGLSVFINFYDSEHLFGYEPKLIVNLSLARATPKIILFVPKHLSNNPSHFALQTHDKICCQQNYACCIMWWYKNVTYLLELVLPCVCFQIYKNITMDWLSKS